MQKYEYNINEEYLLRANQIAEDFRQFTYGCRVLFLIQRHKDGGHTNNSKLRMYVVRDTEEWINALGKLLQEKDQHPEIALRIYQTLNSRNIKKAIHTLKQMQLDADYYDEPSMVSFYIDIKNRWVSALMKKPNKAESNFLIDVDTKEKEEIKAVDDALSQINIEVLLKYPTKNGWHYVTKPFNPNLFVAMENVEIKTDAMMLLAY